MVPVTGARSCKGFRRGNETAGSVWNSLPRLLYAASEPLSPSKTGLFDFLIGCAGYAFLQVFGVSLLQAGSVRLRDYERGKRYLIGKMVEGRYLIESQLGAGGMGAVYIARDLKVLGKTVVVKVLLQEAFENEYVVKKFRQEAEALSRVDHPNIVQILDYGEMDDHHPFLVLQFIDGASLRTILRPGGVELDRTASLIRQVAYALTAAHEKGILHRDLKPENIMLQMRDGEERAVVIDFGIAQLQNSVIAPKTM